MRDLTSTALFSETVGCIYDSAVDASNWQNAIEQVKIAIGKVMAGVSVADSEKQLPLLHITRDIEPDWLRRQAEFMPAILDLTKRRIARGQTVFAYSRDKNAEHSLDDYYRRWITPIGMGDFVRVTLSCRPDRVTSFNLGRYHRDGRFVAEELEFLEKLAPHFSRAMTIGDCLKGAVKADLTSEAMDHIPIGVLILDRQCRLIHSNLTAEKMLADAIFIQCDGQGVFPADHSVRKVFRDSVESCGDGAAGVHGANLAFPLGTHRRASAIAHVLPLSGAGRKRRVADGAAAVIISPRRQDSHSAVETVSAIFGLTKTETTVLTSLLAGAEPSRIAVKLQVTENTVRTHVRALLCKTETHRLHELVARVNNLLSGHDFGAQ